MVLVVIVVLSINYSPIRLAYRGSYFIKEIWWPCGIVARPRFLGILGIPGIPGIPGKAKAKQNTCSPGAPGILGILGILGIPGHPAGSPPRMPEKICL